MINILMIDDDAGDTLMAKEAIEQSDLQTKLHITHDGIEAMAFLTNDGKYADAPRPDLILLDLNMPRMDGHEVLTWLKNQPSLKNIPVIILTTSDASQDVEECYNKQANCFITKPIDLDEFTRVINEVNGFWTQIVKLPGRII